MRQALQGHPDLVPISRLRGAASTILEEEFVE
jgi:hypothetical protein